MTTPPLQPVTEDLTADAEVGGYRLSGSGRRREGGSLLFEARDRSGRPAGLQISAEPVQGRRVRARFRRLARIRAELEHPSLLAVCEVGEHGARPFVATAPVPSRSLASRLGDGPIDAVPAIRLLAAVAEGLDAAHKRGLVHLTFGPESILLDGRDAHLDLFGVFSVTGQASWGDVVRRDPHLRYEPPEAVRGDELDARSNVYSLAAILVHALTGKEPFPQADPMLIEYAHISQAPPKPSERDPRLPRELDALVARGMAKDADERPASAGELLAEAAALLAIGPEALGTVLPNAAPESVAPNPTEGALVEPPAAPPSEAEPAKSPPPEPPDPAPAVAPTAPPPAPAVRPPAAAPSRSRAVLDAWFAGTGETSGRPPTATPPAPIPPPAEEPTFYRPPLRVRLRPFLPLLAAVVVGAVFGLLVGMPGSQPTVAPARAPADLRVVQRLDLVRERLRSDLALALTPAEQADVAERLATAHGVAATRLKSPELESAVQRLSDAYAAMAVAAGDESAEDFASAADEVSAAEDDLTDASASRR